MDYCTLKLVSWKTEKSCDKINLEMSLRSNVMGDSQSTISGGSLESRQKTSSVLKFPMIHVNGKNRFQWQALVVKYWRNSSKC